MKIAMVHFRVGELDGVSLEMDKWKLVLEDMGHEVFYLAGSLGTSKGYCIPEMALSYQKNLVFRRNAFIKLEEFTEDTLEKEIIQIKNKIKKEIYSFIDDNNIEFLVPNNLFCLPLNIPATLALYEVIMEKKLPGINHNHDFIWERTDYTPTCNLIANCLENYFPPELPNFKQVVINSIAQKALINKKSMNSTVVPNVFDFDDEEWVKDEFNKDLRSTLKINESDIVLNQATRIVERKGIELAIDVISRMNERKGELEDKALYNGKKFHKNNFILIFPNLIEDDVYTKKLKEKMDRMNVDYRFCNSHFAHSRSSDDQNKIYSLWDSYVHSDIVTYPSLIEGWGNQFLEAIKAKIPILVYEYSVYESDIGPLGFNIVSLGNKIKNRDQNGLVTVEEEVINNAVDQIFKLLIDSKYRQDTVDENFSIGKRDLSIPALGKIIKELMIN